MFTVIFALGRLPGWIAHWRELHLSPNKKIHRPRQLYVGPPERAFVPVIQRMAPPLGDGQAARPSHLAAPAEAGIVNTEI
jgi:citrate synthase